MERSQLAPILFVTVPVGVLLLVFAIKWLHGKYEERFPNWKKENPYIRNMLYIAERGSLNSSWRVYVRVFETVRLLQRAKDTGMSQKSLDERRIHFLSMDIKSCMILLDTSEDASTDIVIDMYRLLSTGMNYEH